MLDSKIEKLSSQILKSKRILIFTGAGISTESGISDYRSKGGLWQKFHPVTIQEFLASEDKRKEYWDAKRDLYLSFETAQPNDAHRAIAELERLGKLRGIITQNIDGLHQLAGNAEGRILELHGTNRETVCLSCDHKTSWQETHKRLKSENPLYCLRCKGMLKPNTISFGQQLDPDVLSEAMTWTEDCDIVMALGSTLIVEPAASIPRIAQKNGAYLAIINLSETPLDALADIVIQEKTGKVMHALLEKIKANL